MVRLSSPSKRKPKLSLQAHELARWFLSREPERANPEDRKQLRMAENLLRDYPAPTIKLAILLARDDGQPVRNICEAAWNNSDGKMWVTAAAEIVPPQENDMVGWLKYAELKDAIGEPINYPDAVNEYMETFYYDHRKASRESDSHCRPRSVRYEGRSRKLCRPNDEEWGEG